MLFDVRVISFDPHAPSDPVESLMRAFKVERAVARELVHRLPRVIKRGVTLETAQRFCDVLDGLGAHTEIVMTGALKQTEGPARRPGRPQAPTVRTPSRALPGLPAPTAEKLAPLLGTRPENANARSPAQARGSQAGSADALLRSGASSAFSLPEPVTQNAPVPDAVRRQLEEGFEPLRSLPEPREPDPLEADIDGFVERAFVEMPKEPPPRLPSAPAPDPEESRITRAALKGGPEETRPTTPAQPPLLPELRKRRSFRPARPAPELAAGSQVPIEPAREALPPRESRLEPALTPARESRIDAAVTLPREARVEPAVSLPRPEPAAPVSRESRIEPPAAPSPSPLFALALSGPPVDRRKAELPGAQALERNIRLASWLMGFALSVITFGVLPLCLGVLWLRDALRRFARVRAMRGSALTISLAQLPELDAWLKQFAARLELADRPRLYLGRGRSMLEGVPLRGELHLLLDATALSRQLAEGPHVLSFVLAHELSRHALGHRRRGRALLAALWPMLARMDALCADALTVQLLNDRALAQRALLALVAGSFASQVDLTELERQLGSHEREGASYAPALEGASGHLLSRLHHMQSNYLYTATRPSARP